VDDPLQAVIQPSRLCANARVTVGRGISPFFPSVLARVALTERTMADSLTALFINPGFHFGGEALLVIHLIDSKQVIQLVTFDLKIVSIVIIGLNQDGNSAHDFNTMLS